MQLPDLSLLVIMAIFWGTYWVLRLFVLKPLGTFLEEREEEQAASAAALTGALEKQKRILEEIEERLTAARREAMSVRDAARGRAQAQRQELLEAAQKRARATADASLKELDTAIARTRSELAAAAPALAAELASTALGRKVA